ncbi:MAG: aspartate 1-decarboxylase [Ignavibacteriae bacterium]|nr:aspartate 1-decarboxylase [Ignavibacteriota bacterium]MCB9243958.1 aspartate 1-decarboxylase [Ignavibacteriales bacterium]
MNRFMCKSKVHRATITQAELHYEGSLTLDSALMEEANLLPYEKIQVVNINNGNRFETYVIEGERNSGVICLNGAAARLGMVGDRVILIAYGVFSDEELENYKPKVVFVDEHNRIVKKEPEVIEV